MALKIRLRQEGRKNRAFFRLVLTNSRYPRDGKYIEKLGWYDPLVADLQANLNLHGDRIQHWLDQGAILSDRAEALIKRKAPDVLSAYRKKIEACREKNCLKRKAARKRKVTK